MRPKYILIVGQGRSGTNWLLDLLDLSVMTHCRNEPNKLETSLFSQLPSPLVRQSVDDVFGQKWNQAIASAALKMSGRDRIGNTGKSHLYELVRQFGGAYVLSKKKLRLLVSLGEQSEKVGLANERSLPTKLKFKFRDVLRLKRAVRI